MTPEDRRAVIARHARLKPSGDPLFCHPKRAERRADPAVLNRSVRVIYPDRDAAEAAAREFVDLGGFTMVPQPCPRSRSGHYHLDRAKDDARG